MSSAAIGRWWLFFRSNAPFAVLDLEESAASNSKEVKHKTNKDDKGEASKG